MNQIKALQLLDECTGVDIWSSPYCRSRGVPEEWIEELQDAYESSFFRDRETIYYGGRPVNQFHGVHDLGLALKLGKKLGVDVARIQSDRMQRQLIVQRIKEELEEG